MYCSAPLPSSPNSSPTPLPDLDQLVRDTLSGRRRNGLAALKDTLAGHEGAPASAPPQPPAPPQPTQPAVLPASALRPLAEPADPAPADGSLAPLSTLVLALEKARSLRDPVATAASLKQLRRALDKVETEATTWGSLPPEPTLSEPSKPAEPLLPVRRQPWALVLEGCGDAARASALAEALQTDPATARQLALARTPRAVRWGPHAAPLRAAARLLRSQAGLGAVVVSQASLHKSPAAVAVLGPGPDPHHVEITFEPGWLADLPPEAERSFVRWDSVVLSVPGEVVIRRFRSGPRGPVPAGERRVRLVDLHSSDQCLRLVLGLTELRGLPGYTENSGIKSLQALARKVPGAGGQALHSRTVTSNRLPGPDDLARGPTEVAPWPQWEEYTRMARALAGLV